MTDVLSVKQSEAHLKLLRQATVLRGEREKRGGIVESKVNDIF